MSSRRKKAAARTKKVTETKKDTRKPVNDLVDDEEEEVSDGEEKPYKPKQQQQQQQEASFKQPTKNEERKYRKLMKAGKMTQDEFDDKMGITRYQPLSNEESDVINAVQGITKEQLEEARSSHTKDILVKDFDLKYNKQLLLQNATLKIAHGRKYGLIGPNGCGKSTLLKHIASGDLPVPKHIHILYVAQEIEGSDLTALEAVIIADEKRINLLAEEAELKARLDSDDKELDKIGKELADRLADVEDALISIKAASAPSRAAAILSGLQFSEKMQNMTTKEFSGGWRMRISLARALFVRPDLLMLDEPTNHLDLEATIWLEHYLRHYKKTLLLVSHDRHFLDGTIDEIICVRERQLEYYKGNYNKYELGLKLKIREQEKAYNKQQNIIKEIRKKQTPEARKELDLMNKKGLLPKPHNQYDVNFRFFEPEELRRPVIQVLDASFGYEPDNLLFEGLDIYIDQTSKIAIVGQNGSGKTTLMDLILGIHSPLKGEVLRNRNLRVAKFSQHFMDQLDMNQTPITYINSKFPNLDLKEIRSLLGRFQLKGDLHNKPIEKLSGGQKCRVSLCEIANGNPHILFLDEPTNHLDMESVEALLYGLEAFQGGIVLITHDQRMVSSVANELWICRGNKSVEIHHLGQDYEFEDYRREIYSNIPDELFDFDESEEEEEEVQQNGQKQKKK